MKKLQAIALLAGAAALWFPASGFAITPAELVTNVSTLTPTQRDAAIQAAIKENPDDAAAIVDALIKAYPLEAAAYTKSVVDAVLVLNISNEAKGEVLSKVAQSAVASTLDLAPATVAGGDLLVAVNDVKKQLATVPAALQFSVERYTAPIAVLPPTSTPPTSTTVVDTLAPVADTPVVVSNDGVVR